MSHVSARHAPWRSRPDKKGIRRYAFGLEIVSSFPFDAARPTSSNEGRPVSMRLVESAGFGGAWSRRGAVPLVDRRYASGRLFMSIHNHAEHGYRISAPGFGCHVIAKDGKRVLSQLPAAPAWRWQRLLFAQVMPLASILRGFDLFHASAVAIGSRTYGFVAASGIGKSSVAAHLIARNASFVTDDVLAIEGQDDTVRVHPGPSMMALYPSELGAMASEGRARLGRVLGHAGKTYVVCEPVRRPARLGALYFLERTPSAAGVFCITERRPDARTLLSSAFISYVRSPEHLTNHLETCGRIAKSVPLFDVRVPTGVAAWWVAEHIADHIAARAGW